MKKEDKTRVVEELTERLKSAETLIVADYRGLSMTEIDALRGKLIEQGAKFSVVKNTLTRRAAEAAGSGALLALLEGPTAIAFLEAGGDPVAVAKTIADAARTTKILAIRGGVLEGREMSAEEVESLAKLPPIDVLRGQVLGAIIGPLSSLIGLVTAPLQNLHGLIEARIEQLGGIEDETEPKPEAQAEEPEPEAQAGGPEPEAQEEEPEPEAQAGGPEPEAQAEQPESEAPAEEPEPAAQAEETTETAETKEA